MVFTQKQGYFKMFKLIKQFINDLHNLLKQVRETNMHFENAEREIMTSYYKLSRNIDLINDKLNIISVKLKDDEFISDNPVIAGMIKKENQLWSELDLEKANEQLENSIRDTDAKISAKHIGKKLNDYTNEIIKSDMQKIDDGILEAYLAGEDKSEVVLSTGYTVISDLSMPENKKMIAESILKKPFAFWCDIDKEQLKEFKDLELRNLVDSRYSESINALTFGHAGQYYGVILDNNESGYEEGTANYGYKEDGSENTYKKITFEKMIELIKLKDEMLNEPDRLIERRKQFFEKAFQSDFYYHELQEQYKNEFNENVTGFYDTIRDFANILGYRTEIEKKFVRIYKPTKK